MSAAPLLWQVAAGVAASPEVRRTIERRPYVVLGVAVTVGWLLARRAPVGIVPALILAGGRAAVARALDGALRGPRAS